MFAYSKAALMTLAVAALVVSGAAQAAEGRIKARGANGMVAAGAGPNGGAYARGNGAMTNSDGSVTGVSGGAAYGPNGGWGARASTMTVNPDGSAARSGGFMAGGAQGTITGAGSSGLNADGTYYGHRSTQATSAVTGNSYNAATSYDHATGVTHTGTCTGATGELFACPTR
jgi:hypothetical protein